MQDRHTALGLAVCVCESVVREVTRDRQLKQAQAQALILTP